VSRGLAAALVTAALAVAAVCAPGACTRDVNLLPRLDGGAPFPEAGVLACSGAGDPIQLPTAVGLTCAAALATRGHRFALCSCETLNALSRIRTDAFDSRDATVSDELSAAIGVNGGLLASAEVRVGGALYVGGTTGVVASDQVRSAASLRVGGPLTMLLANADIGADAFVAGDVSGSVRVSGALHVPAPATLGSDVQAASTLREAVVVTPPCDCSAGFADAAAAITSAVAANGNAAIALPPDALAHVTAALRLDLPCGVFHVAGIDAAAPVTLAVHGRALLAVTADVAVRASFAVELDPGAELDLVVGGRLSTYGDVTFGATAAPARFRVWIAGSNSVVFDYEPTVAAVIHAPLAAVTAPSGVDLRGSLLARDVVIGADATLHYDRAILAAGTACGQPAGDVVP
jgi:hypothetical protein